jgi:CRP-like cAMP-binding protein
MRSIVTWVALTIVFASSGFALSTTGQLERRISAAHRQLLLMDYPAAQREIEDIAKAASHAPFSWMPCVAKETKDLRAALQFWSGDLVTLTHNHPDGSQDASADSALLLLSANAAFRLEKPVRGNPISVQRLETIMTTYAEVLKQRPEDLIAAYNYEYVGRVRDRLQANREVRPAKSPETVHGTEGGRPEDSNTSPFETLRPLEGDERRETEEAGKRTPRVRRG